MSYLENVMGREVELSFLLGNPHAPGPSLDFPPPDAGLGEKDFKLRTQFPRPPPFCYDNTHTLRICMMASAFRAGVTCICALQRSMCVVSRPNVRRFPETSRKGTASVAFPRLTPLVYAALAAFLFSLILSLSGSDTRWVWSNTGGKATSPTSVGLLDALLDSCRRRAENADDGTSLWRDSGELFYDLPAFTVHSDLPQPLPGAHIPVSRLPVYSISCQGHVLSKQRLARQVQSLEAEGIGGRHEVSSCEYLHGVSEDCAISTGLFARVGLRKTEAAIAVAHIRAWQLAQKRALEGLANGHKELWYGHALFLEDDAVFPQGAGGALQRLFDAFSLSKRRVEYLALWNGDWLWNTEQQRRAVEVEEAAASAASQAAQPLPALYEANGTQAFIPGGVGYLLSISQIGILLDHSFPIDRPLDALFATGSANGGHFLVAPAEPRIINRRVRRGSSLLVTGEDGLSMNADADA
jgi:hypothetical protein